MASERHSILGLALAAIALSAIVLIGAAGLQAAPDVAANPPAVIGTIGVGTGSESRGPEGVAIDPGRNRIFVTNPNNDAIYVINGATDTVMHVISGTVVAQPWGAAYNAGNDRVYVASNIRNSVLVINPATFVIEREISDPDGSIILPDQVVADAQHNRIYVTNSSGGKITVINGNDNQVLNRIQTPLSAPHGIAVDPPHNRLYVGNLFYIPGAGPDIMVAYTTLFNTEVGRRNALAGVQGLAVRTASGDIYVAQSFSDTNQWRVAVVDIETLGFKVGFPGLLINGRTPMGMAYSPGSDRIYVNGFSSNTVDVIDGATNTVVATLPVGVNPAMGIAVNTVSGKVYVANRGSGSVTVIQDAPAGPTVTPTSAASPTATATPVCFADDFEPDNSAAQANPLNTAGKPLRHNLCPAGDQDWHSISVPDARQLTLRTQNLAGGADTIMYLYLADGATELAHDDDGGGAFSSRIVYNFTKAGTYYVMVKDVNPAAYGTLRTYEVVVSGGPPLTRFDYFPVILKNW